MDRHKVSEATYITYLINRQREGTLTASGQQDLSEWLARKEENKQLLEELMDPEQQIKALIEMGRYSRKQETLDKIYKLPKGISSDQELHASEADYLLAESLSSESEHTQNTRPFLNSRNLRNWSNGLIFKAAAVIVLILTIGIYLYPPQKNTSKSKTDIVYDASPGGNRAVITLADGRRINLNESKEAVVITASQLSYNDGTKILGKQETKDSGRPGTQVQALNTISTPKGGQYQIILSDGTKVWLNAASSLKYPEQFEASQRLVELSGEAYFEVSHQPEKPFFVKSGPQTIKVLGTHFNVNAYAEESRLKTTLLKGSVMVSLSNTRNFKILSPGQQSVLRSGRTQNQKPNINQNHSLNTLAIQVQNADVEEATAWKNGYFKFNDEPLESIMRKLSRWYNVEIVYRDQISPDQVFSGRVSRFEAVSSVLEALELTGGVHFKIEERRIIVMK
ncbi:FecR family protein [Pedobacter gandavensis]|uniref:FecR family protein n=1 Tax=Pedobacter gandavensis TaxID=2679963 RepID=UPI0029317D17|nr:FecR family protein [Pedobacter gandavensis]